MTIQCHTTSFEEGTARPIKAFQRMLGLIAVALPVFRLGLLHMRPIQFWLKLRVPSAATPCASTLRQQVRGIIYKSPGRPRLEVTLHAGERPSFVGSEQSALTEGDACAGQDEPWSRYVVKEQRLLSGMDDPPTSSSENLGSLWQSSSIPLRLRRQL